MREAELYSIWAYQKLNHNLQTITGEPVRVLYPGNLNSDQGADFKDACLKIGEKEYRGDVEIHIKKRDWLNHKHQNNPEYNKVILHLIWENDKSIVLTNSQKTIPTLLLSDFYLPEKEIPAKIAYDCHFFSGLDKDQLNYLLLNCGKKRLEEKAKLIRQISYIEPYEEILYKALAASLGSPHNKLGMKLVTAQVKKRELASLKESELEAYIANILGQVGLIEHNHNSALWQKFRIRPASQPAKRVAEYISFRWLRREDNFAMIIWDCFQASLSVKDFMLKVAEIFNPVNTKPFLGKEVLKIVIYNSLLPFLYSLIIDLHHKKNLAKIELYIKEFPKIGNNRVTNSFMNKISDYQRVNLEPREVYYQGLYFLMNNYCQRHDCESCRQERDTYLTIRED